MDGVEATPERKALFRQHTSLSRYRDLEENQSNIATIMCYICLEPIRPHQLIRTLKCFHVFHDRCILQWLTNNDTCPYCRFKFDTVQHIPAEPNQVLIIAELPLDVYFTPNQRVEEYIRDPHREPLQPFPAKFYLVFPLNHPVTMIPEYMLANRNIADPLPNTPTAFYRQKIIGETTYEVVCYKRPVPKLHQRRASGEVDLYASKTYLDQM